LIREAVQVGIIIDIQMSSSLHQVKDICDIVA